MSVVLDVVAGILLVAGTGFFAAGTLGLLRFPDTLSRLHALTKADNLGLGLLVAGLAIHSGSAWIAAKLVLIWFVSLSVSTTICHLLAREEVRE